MSSFIDTGVGLVLSIWFVLAVVLNNENKLIIAKLMMCVVYNEQTVFTHLLTNHLHGKLQNT